MFGYCKGKLTDATVREVRKYHKCISDAGKTKDLGRLVAGCILVFTPPYTS
jgi:hypothetical protein